jgi:uncharacterized protein YndB with AHSA1/START domain
VTSEQHPERAIELEVEVDGTPEEVWRAIATGPGISSWYVPHEVEERAGGHAVASFGPGPEMQIPGRVAAWEPPHRIVFTGEGPGPGLAFEWLVRARNDGACVVRLVNSGFGTGEEWDAQYDGMSDGWRLFLLNLQLHLRHFRGETARSMLPMATWSSGRDEVWLRLLRALGLSESPFEGQQVHTGPGAPSLGGTVVAAAPWRIALLLDDPAPGTAFLAVEGAGDEMAVSVWSYVYGDARDQIVERDESLWRAWLAAH